MGRGGIIKLNDGQRDWYMIWSAATDAPVTYGGSVDDIRAFVQATEGSDGLATLQSRLKRVEAKGTSLHGDASVYETISFNRAGKGETCLTSEQLIAMYCHQQSVVGHEHSDDDDGSCCNEKIGAPMNQKEWDEAIAEIDAFMQSSQNYATACAAWQRIKIEILAARLDRPKNGDLILVDTFEGEPSK